MNGLNERLTEQAIKAWNMEHFGCEKVDIVKAFRIEDRKPVTVFTMHYDWASLTQDREHPSVEVQNLEWNNNFDKRRAFIKEFKANAKKEYQQRKAKRKAQANSLENLCPELAKLKAA